MNGITDDSLVNGITDGRPICADHARRGKDVKILSKLKFPGACFGLMCLMAIIEIDETICDLCQLGTGGKSSDCCVTIADKIYQGTNDIPVKMCVGCNVI